MKDDTGLIMKYFVLNPHKDNIYGQASRVAMLTYAQIVYYDNPALAKDLRQWVEEVRLKLEL